MRRRILILVAVVGLSVGLGMNAQPPRGARGTGPNTRQLSDLAEKLNLGAEQTKAWEAIRTEMETSTESNRARLRELRSEGAGPDDEEVVKAREEMEKAFAKAESDLLDILTDEQKAQYRELKEQALAKRGKGQGQGQGGHGGGKGRKGQGGSGRY